MTRALAVVGCVLSIVVVLAACAEEEEKPPLVTGGNAGHPCERIRGLCAPSVAACGEGRVSAGSSVGCEGAGAVCCIFGSDAGPSPSDAGSQPSDTGATPADASDASSD